MMRKSYQKLARYVKGSCQISHRNALSLVVSLQIPANLLFPYPSQSVPNGLSGLVSSKTLSGSANSSRTVVLDRRRLLLRAGAEGVLDTDNPRVWNKREDERLQTLDNAHAKRRQPAQSGFLFISHVPRLAYYARSTRPCAASMSTPLPAADDGREAGRSDDRRRPRRRCANRRQGVARTC